MFSFERDEKTKNTRGRGKIHESIFYGIDGQTDPSRWLWPLCVSIFGGSWSVPVCKRFDEKLMIAYSQVICIIEDTPLHYYYYYYGNRWFLE